LYAFSASGADMDGVELAALDTLQHRLPGHAEGVRGFEHGQVAVRGVRDEAARSSSVSRMRQGAPGVVCLAGMNPSAIHRGTVEGTRPSSRAASVTVTGAVSLGMLSGR
jgi:hypothetical protein